MCDCGLMRMIVVLNGCDCYVGRVYEITENRRNQGEGGPLSSRPPPLESRLKCSSVQLRQS